MIIVLRISLGQFTEGNVGRGIKGGRKMEGWWACGLGVVIMLIGCLSIRDGRIGFIHDGMRVRDCLGGWVMVGLRLIGKGEIQVLIWMRRTFRLFLKPSRVLNFRCSLDV